MAWADMSIKKPQCNFFKKFSLISTEVVKNYPVCRDEVENTRTLTKVKIYFTLFKVLLLEKNPEVSNHFSGQPAIA